MGHDKVAQDRHHERVRAFGQELINPELKSSPESELGSEDFIFTEYEKEYSNCNTQKGDRPVVESANGRHAWSISLGRESTGAIARIPISGTPSRKASDSRRIDIPVFSIHHVDLQGHGSVAFATEMSALPYKGSNLCGSKCDFRIFALLDVGLDIHF